MISLASGRTGPESARPDRASNVEACHWQVNVPPSKDSGPPWCMQTLTYARGLPFRSHDQHLPPQEIDGYGSLGRDVADGYQHLSHRSSLWSMIVCLERQRTSLFTPSARCLQFLQRGRPSWASAIASRSRAPSRVVALSYRPARRCIEVGFHSSFAGIIQSHWADPGSPRASSVARSTMSLGELHDGHETRLLRSARAPLLHILAPQHQSRYRRQRYHLGDEDYETLGLPHDRRHARGATRVINGGRSGR